MKERMKEFIDNNEALKKALEYTRKNKATVGLLGGGRSPIAFSSSSIRP